MAVAVSHIGDLIIQHGPWVANRGAEQIDIELRLSLMNGGDLNALRDELLELRALASPPPAECSAETYSWWHFIPEKLDGYWIRCTLQGPHDEHKDEHTGLTWKTPAEEQP